MKRITAMVIACLVLPSLAAQGPSSLNVTGAGARSTGMGGAFTAIADDATAAFYNPAGLCQLKRIELTGVGYYSLRRNEPIVPYPGRTYKAGDVGQYSVNFGSVVFPLSPETKNFVLAASIHKIIAFDLAQEVDERVIGGAYGDGIEHNEGSILGGIYAYSGMLAYEVNEMFSVGCGLSQFGGRFRMEMEETTVYDSFPDDYVYQLEVVGFDCRGGPQWTFGGLAKLTRGIRLGAMIRTPVRLDLESDRSSQVTVDTKDYGSSIGIPPIEMELPLAYAIGVAYRPYDLLNLACDYHFYQWSENEMKAGSVYEKANLDDSGQLHLGLEYLLSRLEAYPIPLRLGFYTFPLGSPNAFNQILLDLNILDANTYRAETRKFYTAGVGLITADAVADIAVEYSPLAESRAVDGVTYSNEETVAKVYLSFIYKFGAIEE